jgi:uncharacterized protein YecE (DUF72 family)
MAPRLRIGCSGWNYKSWRGRFYPTDLPAAAWLRFYVGRFDTVETNATFYRLPAPETFASWREQTPDGFVMAIKASRYLTHLKRLRDPDEPVARLFEHAAGLGSRLGPVLYQLPASLERDSDRLARLLDVLPERLRLDEGGSVPLQHVFEFRHPSWYVEDTFARLAERGATVCLHDMAGSAIDAAGVGPFTYVRFHGAAGKYHGSYGDDVLERWARRLAGEWRGGRDVYGYFNNDPEAVATHDARRLREMTRAAAGLDATAAGALTASESEDVAAPRRRLVRSHA